MKVTGASMWVTRDWVVFLFKPSPTSTQAKLTSVRIFTLAETVTGKKFKSGRKTTFSGQMTKRSATDEFQRTKIINGCKQNSINSGFICFACSTISNNTTSPQQSLPDRLIFDSSILLLCYTINSAFCHFTFAPIPIQSRRFSRLTTATGLQCYDLHCQPHA
ncbi:hypothetical protein T265_08118 [Opisthorchis viverrini]|uniref:Uncharacterized protein n=1 Tax=Opisthorchis viverrini TaxID=6198 RepID=A0A074ZLA2_OPIVI|nr:hypothetical protein T265_08118 [Opisthorchis viverrini]KER24130.1 hypothetical protein T265_08118 [Opisthorchis viverrini]